MTDTVASSIMHKAGALLSRRPYSRGELRAKLAALGEAAEVEKTLDRLEELNVLNDATYSYNLASMWIKQAGWGPLKVRFHLLRRQVSAAVAESAVDRVRQEVSDGEALTAYLNRRARQKPMPEDRRGIRKLIGALRQRGFTDETIWTELRRRIPTAAWKVFDTGE